MIKQNKLRLPIWVVILGLMLGVGVLGVSAIQVRAQAEEPIQVVVEDEKMVEGEGLVVVAAVEQEKVDYYLPYPGILPDHPLYWLKMVRDRIQLWLITSPLAKAEKLLMYADKRLGAGWALIDGNKQELGVSTLTKAEKYLERAIMIVLELGDEGEEVIFKEKLTKAKKKHEEVLISLAAKVGEEQARVVNQILAISRTEGGVEQTEVVESEVELMVEFGEGDEPVVVEVVASSVLKALMGAAEEKSWLVGTKEYDFGILVEEIDGRKNSTEKAWIYFVNGEAGQVAADQYQLEPEDVVEWKYIKPVF